MQVEAVVGGVAIDQIEKLGGSFERATSYFQPIGTGLAKVLKISQLASDTWRLVVTIRPDSWSSPASITLQLTWLVQVYLVWACQLIADLFAFNGSICLELAIKRQEIYVRFVLRSGPSGQIR